MRTMLGAVVVFAAAMGISPQAGYGGDAIPTITITATEYKFTPDKITSLRARHKVRFVFTNAGTMNHEIVSPAIRAGDNTTVSYQGIRVQADRMEEIELEKGKTVTIDFSPDEKGTFQFWCGQKTGGKSHRDLGMQGTFIITR